MQEIYDGCLGDGHKQTDFLMDGTDTLPTLVKQNNKRFFYNQGNQDWSKKSCTIFGSIGAISDLMDYEFSLDEIKEIDTESYNKGRVQGKGRYVGMAVDLCRERRNSNKKLVEKYGKIASYYIDMKDDETVLKCIKENYNIVTGYNGNAKYNADYQADCVLDGTSFGVATYGHCNNVIYEDKVEVKDNYYGRKYNIYELKNNPSKITCWHNGGYLFTKVAEDNYERVKELNEMKTMILTNIDNNSKLRNLSKSEFHRTKLHEGNERYRERLDYINEKLSDLK